MIEEDVGIGFMRAASETSHVTLTYNTCQKAAFETMMMKGEGLGTTYFCHVPDPSAPMRPNWFPLGVIRLIHTGTTFTAGSMTQTNRDMKSSMLEGPFMLH